MEEPDFAWQRNVLLIYYQEIGEHLRAGGDLRDRLAALYLTMLASAAAGFLILQAQSPALMRLLATSGVAFALAFGAFGELVLWGVIASRIWHAEYVNCMILLQAMIRASTMEPSPDLVDPRLRCRYLPGATTSRTFMIVQLGILFAISVGAKFASTWPQSICPPYLAGTLLSCVSVLLNLLLSRRALQRAEEQFWEDPATSWCFAGFRDPLQHEP